MQKASLGVKSQGCQAIMRLASSRRLCIEIHLGKKLHLHVGGSLRAGQMWRKKADNWLKVNKDGEERPCINDLSGSFLSSFLLMRTPALFLVMHLCLASILTKQIDRLFLCVLPHLLLCCASNNKLCTCLYSCGFHDKCIFSLVAKIQGKIAYSL